EIRIGQDALDHRFDAAVELAALLASAAIEGGHLLYICLTGWPAEGLGGQRGDDPARAAGFLAGVLRVALEDAAPALRIGGRRALERTFDEHLAHVRVERVTGNRAGRVHGALEGFVEPGVRQVAGGEEGHADAMEAGLDRQGRRLATIATLVGDV